MRQLIAGNWKMHGTCDALGEVDAIAKGAPNGVDALLCLPATLIAVAAKRDGAVPVGGQDCHFETQGAHTGDVSALMLKDAGASAVIVGHSERRADHGETNEIVKQKAAAALREGLTAIVCVGETEGERDAGRTLDVLGEQVSGSIPDGATGVNTVVAYEPVWAIGTGRTASIEDVEAAHAHIRRTLRDRLGEAGDHVRILYGGSVKPANAGELLAIPGVDGALVGGASLKASDFLAICAAART